MLSPSVRDLGKPPFSNGVNSEPPLETVSPLIYAPARQPQDDNCLAHLSLIWRDSLSLQLPNKGIFSRLHVLFQRENPFSFIQQRQFPCNSIGPILCSVPPPLSHRNCANKRPESGCCARPCVLSFNESQGAAPLRSNPTFPLLLLFCNEQNTRTQAIRNHASGCQQSRTIATLGYFH